MNVSVMKAYELVLSLYKSITYIQPDYPYNNMFRQKKQSNKWTYICNTMPCSKSVYCYRIIFTKQEAQRRSAENVRNMDNKITDIKKKI